MAVFKSADRKNNLSVNSVSSTLMPQNDGDGMTFPNEEKLRMLIIGHLLYKK
jgi:hypothetical protein